MLRDRWQEVSQEIDRKNEYRYQTIEEQLSQIDEKIHQQKPID